MHQDIYNDSRGAAAPLLVDRREAARLLGVSPALVEKLRASGELRSLKIGARRLFAVADLTMFICECRDAHNGNSRQRRHPAQERGGRPQP
jgi:excisionase family DNA binding protein